MNIIDVAIDKNVKNNFFSTDKACDPINFYGIITKLASDKLFIAGNNYVGKKYSFFYSKVRKCYWF